MTGNGIKNRIQRTVSIFFLCIVGVIKPEIASWSPDFIIVGGQKCGTTSLYDYLVTHPDIDSAKVKEIHFFDSKNFKRGISWYRSQFPKKRPHKLTGEASPYYLFHPLVPERIRDYFPNIKIIILLRNPAERAWSHYKHNVRHQYEKQGFKRALECEDARLSGQEEKMIANNTYYSQSHRRFSYVSRGIYINQLKRWTTLFPPEQILIIRSEDLFSQTDAVVNHVFSFLGVSEHHQEQYSIKNTDSLHRKMDEDIRKQLIEYFRPYNEQLEDFLGMSFNWE